MTTPIWLASLTPYLPEASPSSPGGPSGPWVGPAPMWALGGQAAPTSGAPSFWGVSDPTTPGAWEAPGLWGGAEPWNPAWGQGISGSGAESAGAWGIRPWPPEAASEPTQALTPARAPREIIADLRLRLDSLPFETGGVEVRVDDDGLKLEGTIGSLPAKRLVEDAAISVAGVSDAHNSLELEIRADDEITHDLSTQLGTMTWSLGENIAVESHEGKVTLTGDVSSFLLKRVIEDMALLGRGVKDVDNKIRVGPTRASESTES